MAYDTDFLKKLSTLADQAEAVAKMTLPLVISKAILYSISTLMLFAASVYFFIQMHTALTTGKAVAQGFLAVVLWAFGSASTHLPMMKILGMKEVTRDVPSSSNKS